MESFKREREDSFGDRVFGRRYIRWMYGERVMTGRRDEGERRFEKSLFTSVDERRTRVGLARNTGG